MNDEDIKILEELLNKKYDDELLNTLEMISKEDEVYILTIFEKQAIKNLLKENEELSEENAILKRANNISEDVKIEDITKFINKSIEDFNKEYIPVAKIKEKIEELDIMIEKINRGELQKYTVSEIFTFKAIYEKLLEGK